MVHRGRLCLVLFCLNCRCLGELLSVQDNCFVVWGVQATVVSYDYSGYGLADGEPSEKNMCVRLNDVCVRLHAADICTFRAPTSSCSTFVATSPCGPTN